MKRYLLDTSLIAAFLHGRPNILRLVDLLIQNGQAATSILVYGEVVAYLKVSLHLRNTKYGYKNSLILTRLPPIPLYPILERYADIRRALGPLHKDIGDIDTLIAATALEENLTLLTIDRDYERVPGLTYELINLKAS